MEEIGPQQQKDAGGAASQALDHVVRAYVIHARSCLASPSGPGKDLGEDAGGDHLRRATKNMTATISIGRRADVLAEQELDDEEIEEEQRADAAEGEADDTEEMARPVTEAHEEHDRQQVEHDAEGARDAIFGLAEAARIVA